MYSKTKEIKMLELEYRMTARGTWDYPEEGYDTIHAEFELDIEGIIEDEGFEADELADYTLKEFVPTLDKIKDFGWCDVEFQGKKVRLDDIWDLTLGELRCEKIYFLETEG